MEATRTGSFDEEMYRLLSEGAEIQNTLTIGKGAEMYWQSQAEEIEQRIADSHSLDSNFGFK